MSRHKLVKTMNLDDELDDFDGADFEDDYDESEESRLQRGVEEVRTILGPSVNVSAKSIEDSLWHYYYDVTKTVNYLLPSEQQAPAVPTAHVEKHQTSSIGRVKDSPSSMLHGAERCCHVPFCVRDFFADAPWRHVPPERQGEILIEPLYPGGGLRGGSPATGDSKLSKLATLAAARKKKENEKHVSAESQGPNASVAMLEKLDTTARSGDASLLKEPTSLGPEAPLVATNLLPMRQGRKYPSKRRDLSPTSTPGHETPKKPPPAGSESEDPMQGVNPQSNSTAAPSTFAKTVLGDAQDSMPSSLAPLQSLTLAFPQSLGAKTKSDPFAGPSPDDLVAKAQSSSKGHVDAGKSTLMGRLLYDLKVVDQRTIDRYRKEAEKIGKSSFALAWVLDQGTEERNRGVTIDIAMNKFETPTTNFTILDAPGHRDFIPNMIAGASQADFAILVIDAGTGNFESGLRGQTKEHALLVRSMGVQRIVVAVNKLDTVQWSKDRFDEIQQQVSAFLTAAGFQSRNIAFVPCSGLNGDNIVKRAEDPQAKWYTGPILIEQLEALEPTRRSLDKPIRLTIADIFRGGVQNPLSISGRLDCGSMQVGDRIIAMPAKETAVVKGIEVDSEPAEWAVAGQNVILHLTDIEQKHLKAGDVVCPPSAPIQNVTSVTVKMLAFEHVTPMHVEVHRGRLQIPGRITQLVAILDKVSGTTVGKKKPRLVQPGSVARVVVELESAVPLEAPAKVILRAGGQTVAAGLLE
ncbi:MAG: hypothetical protein Q9168_003121 [Polycauliona sp. 1 TL-2023]